ncbi:sulfite oxidase [Tunicatimonas pelagia]|uniref:sulfite oxidase n=1 Tax=Tunicatimonas pelagia TaxID=931531 RepID=UPI002664FB13|nr:sulfite oxidase [Tunicatimonas pelagia]WKN42961.1 sulfite oxidase [Tunicatimonas pelagia]
MLKADQNRPVVFQGSVWNRRSFLRKSALSAMSAALGTHIVHSANLPAGYLPLVFTVENNPMDGKDEAMIVRSERPWNVEAPPHLLDEEITTFPNIFIRNNGVIPQNIDAKTWTLAIGGESVKSEKSYNMTDLKQKFQSHTYQLTLECGGNGRAGYYPPASGNQWEEGAIYCAEWTGVRLRDVLTDVGIKDDAVYIGYYGKDKHLSGDPNKVVISRGVPIEKAIQDETLIAWAMNSKDIPLEHGYPLRLVCGGWPASASGKWIHRIDVRNQIHDGPKMGGNSYRVPEYPVAPGEEVSEEDFKIIESMPVKSLITYPKSGAMFDKFRKLEVRGHAWAGERSVAQVEVSTDFGATWQSCTLQKPVNRLAWQHWSTELEFPIAGYYEVWAKATDDQGVAQPMVIPGWNPKGYLNNACHRIAVKVK